MKKLLTLSFLLICFSINAQLFHEELVNRNLTVQQIIDQTETHYSDRDKKGRGTGYKQFQRWRYWALRNMDANGMIRSNRKALESYNRFRNIYGVNQRTASGNYIELGPKSTVPTSTWSSALGRVSAIGHDENNDNHIIVGSPTGGIWKTLDLGANWIPLFDDQLLMDVYSLEISHVDPDIYWAGLSDGLLRSFDGGSSWQTVSGMTSGLFNTIEMHPNDPSLVFAIRQSPSPGEVWRSDDGGQNFTRVFEHTLSMYDLEFHPTNPDIIYASGNGGVFMSTDKGISFIEITTGLWSGNPLYTMMVAVTPAAPSNIYVLEEAGGGFNALYHSTNEGLTWNTITDNACECLNLMGIDLFENDGQGPRDMDIVVSPVDPNIIHVAGIETYRTQNLGQNWQQTTEWNNPGQPNFIHADIDLLIYDDERILAGTDGGIYFSTDDGTSWTDISSGLGIRQLYRMGASQTDVDRVSGGSQDNGTGILVSGTWFDWLGADGMETFIDFSNSNIVYGTSQNGGLYKSLDGGQSTALITEPGVEGNWVTPFEQDPIDPNTIYTARRRLWKSIDGGINWADILQFNPVGRADEMAIAPSDNNYIYVSYRNNLYYSSDGGNNWASNDLPGFQLNYIIVHPFDPQRLAIVISGANAKIMESFDGGVSFVDITANIPTDVSIECVVYEQLPNGGLFVGGNPGVYYTADSSNPNWLDNSINLPKVRITELEIRNQVMYVSTYGRGLWKFEFDCDSSVVGQACKDFDVCTINDVFDANCECAGVGSDSDGDGVCDGLDVCNGGDDNIDGDNDGIPDLCDGCAIGCTDSDCDSVCDVDDLCPNGDDTRDSDGDGIPDYCDDCSDDDFDGICNENDICEGSDSSDVDGDGIPDGCDDCNDLAETPAIRLEIKLDGFPSETSWEIVNDLGSIVFSSVDYVSFAPGDIVIETFCSINTGCYEFIIRDDFGDGICCYEGDGYYLLTNSVGDILASGGEFNDIEITEFCLSSSCGSSGNDSDSDGICDDLDCDDNDANIRGLGSTCNDFDACTSEDVYDSNCNCVGVLIDSDSDGICDLNDICAGSDDNIDSDNDGIPDGCDDCDNFIEPFIVNVEIKLDNFPSETYWEIMDDSGDIVFSNSDYDSFSSGDIILESYCPFNEGCYNFTIYDAYGDGICCLQGDGYYLLTNQIGDTIAYGGEFQFLESTEFCFSNCISSGGDSDSDGICDLNDLCPGYDDNIDTDSDGIPDGCDDCVDTEKTIDGEFDEIDSPSIPNWTAHEGGGALMGSTINHYNKAVLDIEVPGTFNYNLQLWQDDLTMEADKLYVIETDLRADRTRFVTLKLRNKPNGTTYFEKDIEVLSSSKEMAFIFRSPVLDNDLRLTLQVGGNSESVYVDHIRFREFCANNHDLLDCIDQLTIDDDLVDSDLFKAVERIESAALISNSSQVVYEAGDNILLLPNFEVEQGVIFVADIKACIN